MVPKKKEIRTFMFAALLCCASFPLLAEVAVLGESVFEKPDDVPPVDYIRDEIPEAEVPQTKGEYYEAVVPDTVNLEENARLFVDNYLQGITVPQLMHEPYSWAHYDLIPPRTKLGLSSYMCAWAKYRESLPLMRIMCGSKKGLEIDETWAKHLLHCIGPDGLFYVPKTGRPWDDTGPYEWWEGEDLDFYTYHHTGNGRLLGALSAYYQMTGDEIWNDTAKGVVDRLNELAIKVDDVAFYSRFKYLPGEQLTRKEIEEAIVKMYETTNSETAGNTALWQTWIITGLSQYYRISGYEPAGELARKLLNYQRNCDYIENWGSHFHCISLGMHAALELAYATGDKDLARYAQKQYEVVLAGDKMISIPEIGYFVNATGAEQMEGCSIGDMTTIALRLTQLGVGDYWEDVDRYVRNILTESQIRRADQVEAYCEHLQEQGKATEEEVLYWQLADRLPQRLVGATSLHFQANELIDAPYFETCCTGNCTRAYYYVWENMLECDEGNDELTTHLLINRSSPWVDIDSYIPYEGKVQFHFKSPCRKATIRINDWIDKSKVRCSLGGSRKDFSWDEKYLVVEDLPSGQTLTIEFPISERRVQLKSFGHEYDSIFKGNDCVMLSPQGTIAPLFQREHYRQNEPRYIKTTRFACEDVIDH